MHKVSAIYVPSRRKIWFDRDYYNTVNAHARPRRLPMLPIHGSIAFQAVQQLVGDDAERVTQPEDHCHEEKDTS